MDQKRINRKAAMKSHFSHGLILGVLVVVSVVATVRESPSANASITISHDFNGSITPSNVTRVGGDGGYYFWENLNDPYYTRQETNASTTIALTFAFTVEIHDHVALCIELLDATKANITIHHAGEAILIQENINSLYNYTLDLLPFVSISGNISLVISSQNASQDDYIYACGVHILLAGIESHPLTMDAHGEAFVSLDEGKNYTLEANHPCKISIFTMPDKQLLVSTTNPKLVLPVSTSGNFLINLQDC